jgi:hypothetical protein
MIRNHVLATVGLPSLNGIDFHCQVAAGLAISQGCGQAGGQVSQELANPQVGKADGRASAAYVVVLTA